MSSRPATYSELMSVNTATTIQWLQKMQRADNSSKEAGCFEFDLDVLREEGDDGQERGHSPHSHPQSQVVGSEDFIATMTSTRTEIDTSSSRRMMNNFHHEIETPVINEDAATLPQRRENPVTSYLPQYSDNPILPATQHQPPQPSIQLQQLGAKLVPNKKEAPQKRRSMSPVSMESNPESAMSPEAWNDCFQKLVQFRLQYGHTNVKKFSDKDNLTAEENNTIYILKVFIDLIQREKKKMSRAEVLKNSGDELTSAILTPDRIKALDDLGFNWGKSYAPKVPYEVRIKELKAFKQKYGHCFVPISYNRGLSQFCSRLRSAKHATNRVYAARLTPQKLADLDAIGFEWHSRKTARLTDRNAGRMK